LSAHERTRRSGAGVAKVSLASLQPAALLDQTPSGQVFLTLDGTLLFANAAFRRLVQLGETSPLDGHCLQDYLTTGGAIFYETQLAPTLLMRGSASEISLDLKRSDGERVPVLINAVLSRNEEGVPNGILIALFGAGLRRDYENELLRARRELEQVAEVVRRSSDAILSVKADGTIQSWNLGAEQIFGYSSVEVIGKSILSLFGEQEKPEIRHAMGELESGAGMNRDTFALRKTGERMEVSVVLTPHLEAPGTMVAFSAILRDITIRKLSERALIQSEKLASVGRLASSIAHEINNPLESVTNLLYILESRISDEENKSLVVTAQEELARVSHIATHTLKFHRQSSSRTFLDLGMLIDSVAALYRARLQGSGIAISNDCNDASHLCCFEGELRQILVNLVSNAFDAMRSGGHLRLRCRDVTLWSSGTKGVRVTVADTGSGMDATTVSRIFEPFFSTKGIGGTGLGMWITKELIEKNDGTVKVRSNVTPGRSGTVVSLFFPQRTDC
jgi:PAS domain S-box-containing protein